MKLAKNRDSIRPSEGVSHMKWNFWEGISLPLVGQGMPRGDRVVLAPILCARKCTRGAHWHVHGATKSVRLKEDITIIYIQRSTREYVVISLIRGQYMIAVACGSWIHHMYVSRYLNCVLLKLFLRLRSILGTGAKSGHCQYWLEHQHKRFLLQKMQRKAEILFF